LKNVLAEMQTASDDEDVLVLMPRMSLVWARKPVVSQNSADVV
jgi:hypothetical protein